jgi:hypothetical protein
MSNMWGSLLSHILGVTAKSFFSVSIEQSPMPIRTSSKERKKQDFAIYELFACGLKLTPRTGRGSTGRSRTGLRGFSGRARPANRRQVDQRKSRRGPCPWPTEFSTPLEKSPLRQVPHFQDRYEFGVFLVDLLKSYDPHQISYNPGLWSWLAVVNVINRKPAGSETFLEPITAHHIPERPRRPRLVIANTGIDQDIVVQRFYDEALHA